MSNTIEIIISATNRAAQPLRDVMGGLDDFGRGLDRIGDRAINIGGQLTAMTAPLAIGLAGGLRAASDFDAVMAEISARTGIVGEDLEAISDLALQMGADTAFSAQEAAEAFLQLLSSGQNAEQAIATLPAVLDAAAASGEDLGRTADAVTDIMAAFQLGVEDADDVVEALARAAGASSATMGDLAAAFTNIGGDAAAMGLDVEEVNAILATFAENGVKGGDAGTQLRSMLRAMQAPTDAVADAWSELGTSLYDNEGNVRDLNEVIEEMNIALADMPAQQANRLLQTLGGSYGVMGLRALIAADGFDTMQQNMEGATGASEVAAARMDTFAGRVDALRGSLETLAIRALTPTMNNVLTPFVERVTELINAITDWTVANPELTDQIILLMGAAVAAGPALIGIGTALKVIGTAIALVSSPIALIAGAVAGLAYAYETNFMGIRDTVNGVVADVGARFEGLGPVIQSVADWFTGTLVPAAQQTFETDIRPIIEGFIETLEGIWRRVSPALTTLSSWFTDDLLPAVTGLYERSIRPFVESIVRGIGGIWEAVSPGLGELLDWFVNTGLPTALDFLSGTVIPAIEPFINTLKDIWEDVAPALGDLLKWFVEEGLPTVLNFIVNDAVPVIERLISTISGILEDIRPYVNELVEFFTGSIQTIIDIVQQLLDLLGVLTLTRTANSSDLAGRVLERIQQGEAANGVPDLGGAATQNGFIGPALRRGGGSGGTEGAAGDTIIQVMMPTEALASPARAAEAGDIFGATIARRLRERG